MELAYLPRNTVVQGVAIGHAEEVEAVRDAQVVARAILGQWVAYQKAQDESSLRCDDAWLSLWTCRCIGTARAHIDAVAEVGHRVDVPTHHVKAAVVETADAPIRGQALLADALRVGVEWETSPGGPRRAAVVVVG